MGDHKQLHDREAVKKIQEIIKHQGICMMITDTGTYPGHSRPMAVAQVDDEGDFWFLSMRTTAKYNELLVDPKAVLHFANPSDQEFLSVNGTCTMVNDMAKKKELWNPLAGAWVPGGVEDPDLTIIKLTPHQGYYWDTKNGKIVAAIKIAFSLVTGKTSDDGGVEGTLKV